VTPEGRAWFEDQGLDLEAMRSKRGAARQRLDWTERRNHLAGPLGVTLLSRMVALGWIETVAGSRGATDDAWAGGAARAAGVDLDSLEGREAA